MEESDLSYTMGSVAWMAPEVIASARQFSKKADVYSYGVICWELFTGTDPCPEDMAHINLANKVLHEEWRPTIPENVPYVWTQLIQQCWAQRPDSRPSFTEILGILDSIEMNPPFPMGPVDLPPPQEDPKDDLFEALRREREQIHNLMALAYEEGESDGSAESPKDTNDTENRQEADVDKDPNDNNDPDVDGSNEEESSSVDYDDAIS